MVPAPFQLLDCLGASSLLELLDLCDLESLDSVSSSGHLALEGLDNVWKSATAEATERRRVKLVERLLEDVEVADAKELQGMLRHVAASGVNGGMELRNVWELYAAIEACRWEDLRRATSSNPSQLLFGRLLFDREDLDAVLDFEEDPRLPQQAQTMCFSNELRTFWLGSSTSHPVVPLSVSVGCRSSTTVLELTSPLKEACSDEFEVNLTIIDPRLQDSVHLSTVATVRGVGITGSTLTIDDASFRDLLSVEEGLLCTLRLEHRGRVRSVPDQLCALLKENRLLDALALAD